jgi:hypothetical protein
LSSIPKNDPLYRIINLSKQLAVNESKANYGIKGNSPEEEDKKEIIKRDV